MRRLTLIALATVAFAFGPAAAQTNPQRVRRQQRRIEHGEATGQLTPREAGNLEHQEGHIAQERAAARADGHVSRSERRHIRHDLQRTSRQIWRKKHNYRHRPMHHHRYRHHPLHHPRVYRHRHHVDVR